MSNGNYKLTNEDKVICMGLAKEMDGRTLAHQVAKYRCGRTLLRVFKNYIVECILPEGDHHSIEFDFVKQLNEMDMQLSKKVETFTYAMCFRIDEAECKDKSNE